jgi:hypothetical protein
MPPRRNRRGIAATSAKKSPIAPTKQPARVQKPPGNPISTRRRPAITTSPAEESMLWIKSLYKFNQALDPPVKHLGQLQDHS